MDTSSNAVVPRVKRTYNLSKTSVEIVKRLAEEHLRSSQDAVVERAIRDLHRKIRDAQEEILWCQAAEDPEFMAEMREIETGFAADDDQAWQQ